MALRYLTLISIPQNDDPLLSANLARRLSLAAVFSAPGVQVFADAPPPPLLLKQNEGVVLGHLFRKTERDRPVGVLNEAESRAIVSNGGRPLITDSWGGYVAVLCGEAADSFTIVRDPSGALPCYLVSTPCGVVCASDIETIFESGLFVPSINWQAIQKHLLSYDLRTAETCLDGVSELLAGQRVVISADRTAIDHLWSPWDHIGTQRTSFHDAADRLREVTTQCLLSWSTAFPNVLLGISGGLDSSIIATTLGQHSRAVTCLTMATDHIEGDERPYARMAATAFDLPLIERFHCADDVNLGVSTSRHLPRPVLPALAQSEYKTKVELCREIKADAYLTGIGGDNVFCHMRSATPLVDRVISTGFSREAWRTLNDICTLTGCSYWDAGLMAFRRATQGGRRYPWTFDYRLLRDVSSLPPPWHPWLEAPAGCLPGKAAHVAMLLRIQGTIDGFPRRGMVPMINPLLSQPIVEACLAIPTWEWIRGGEDRAVARQAFADRLPPALAHRRSKGGPGTFAAEIIERARHEILELLDGGLLDKHGLIDLTSIHLILAGTHPIPHQHLPRLLLLAETETWCRYWLSRSSPIGGSSAPPN